MLRLVAEQRQLPRRALNDRQVRWAPASLSGSARHPDQPVLRRRVRVWAKAAPAHASVTAWCASGWCSPPREEWHAFLIDHHPGYITVERYEANQVRLRANCLGAARVRQLGRRARGPGAAAGAGALRALRAAGCKSATAASRCPRATAAHAARRMYGTAICQSVGGRRIEQLVLDAVFARARASGDRRHPARDRNSSPTPTTLRCARPSWSSSARARTPTAHADSSTAASLRTASSRARWRASGNDGC